MTTWAVLIRLLRARFILADHGQQLLLKIEKLRQGPRSPDDYYKDLRALLQRSGTRYEEPYILAKFLAGLNSDVADIVLQIRHTSCGCPPPCYPYLRQLYQKEGCDTTFVST